MSNGSPQVMINSHASGFWSHLSETAHLWRQRQVERHYLADWTERDLNDLALTWSEVALEAEKPFWRA